MKGAHRESTVPASCPICHAHGGQCNKGVHIAGGDIYKCKECSGYYLSPPKRVEYTNSEWTSRREKEWQTDIRIAERFAPKILKYTSAQLGRPVRRVLEIGCGTAYMGKGFSSLGCEYTGIDVDATSIELAKSKGIEAHCMAIEEICDASSTIRSGYDLIISSNVFEHLDDPSKAFSNLRHISNGIIVVIVPNAQGLFTVLRANRGCSKMIRMTLGSEREVAYSIDGYWHNISYTKQTLNYLCAKAGIEVLALDLISINDPVFGFVQPNPTFLYRMASAVAAIVKMESEIILVGRLKSA